MNSRSRRFAASLVAVVGLVAAGCSTTPGGPDPQAPVAAIQAVPTTGTAPLTVDFGSVGSNDPDGTISTYSWNFGDGSPLENGPGATHIYTAPGNFTATLIVTDNSGMTGSATTNINVVDPGSGCAANPDPLDANGDDTNCDGVDGIALAQVLVDAGSGSDVGACGTVVKPCATIANGVATATAAGKNIILVTAGDYDAFDITNGRIVRGGYNPTFNGRIPAGTRVHGALDSANNTYYGVRANNITSVTKLLDLKINAEGTAGNASSGVIVKNASAKVILENVTVTAGAGLNPTGVLATNNSKVDINNSTVNSGTALGAGSSAYGVRSLSGSTVNVNGGTITAAAGNNSSNSSTGAPATPADACTGGPGTNGQLNLINNVAGGGISCNPWFTTVTNGGSGGAGYFSQAGDPGVAGGQGAGAAGGAGGCGSTLGCGTGSKAGNGGAGGAGGAAGAAGANNFANAADLWSGGRGGNGTNGAEGGGGGGGGGGSSASAIGGGGGAGGAGGAAGLGATFGGYAGGGSFGVYAVNATASLTNVTVTVGNGGNGGSGSNGGVGGKGGNGGAGGDAQCCQAGGGSGGGAGAGGGGGSGAGGGAGGPALAALHTGTGTLTTTSVVTNLPAAAAAGGAGGTGGAGGAPGAGGAGGAKGGTSIYGNGGQTGGAATAGAAGANGAAGNAGQVLRYWDNGTATP